MNGKMKTFGWILAGSLLASPAAAHTGVPGGLGAGLLHPLLGLDHLLALVALGLWAGWMGKADRLLLPLLLVAGLGIGMLAGFAGVYLPAVESMIALSVLVFGLFASVAARPGRAIALIVAAGFGLFHGYAHAVEMPLIGSLYGYAGGILASSALVTGLAALSGDYLLAQQRLVRALGGGVALTGLTLLVAG